MNDAFSPSPGRFRLRYLAALGFFFLALNLAVRLVLQLAFPDMLPFSAFVFAGAGMGGINDLAALVFVILLPATLILTPTDAFLKGRAGRVYATSILFVYTFIFVFTAFAEYFFWDEFNSRFNFIAVDYLVYTTELLRNMLESYPMTPLMLAVFCIAAGFARVLWKWIRQEKLSPCKAPRSSSRFALLGGLYVAAILVFMLFTPLSGSQGRYWNEYAKNGVYQIFSAYLNNQLDYRAFYKTMNKREAYALVQSEMSDAGHAFTPGEEENLVRLAGTSSPETRPNVIVVIMESMGSQWLGEYTPNLSRLAQNGLSFSNMAATGTRTVRGIEAVMLSIPPTPGNSIVRRPDNGKLFNLGSEFRAKGYDLKFIYGGIGFFDNMNPFFEGNGYTIVDKLGFSRKNKTFSTAWGQCDEDLYAESLTRADESYASGKAFHQVLLTTSNHRPFNYPEGKVAIAPGTSRKGAVSYSDYAIGNFMREAESKPWFENTVFLFVGDHPSSIAGKTELPADGYGILCIMYGPRFFQPEQVTALCSQIDVAPTLLASLGWEYKSSFFGTNARELPADKGRAWISTYQLLGFRTNDQLVTLSPDGQARIASLKESEERGEKESQLVAKAVAFYQCAYDLFTEKKLKEVSVAGEETLTKHNTAALAVPHSPSGETDTQQ